MICFLLEINGFLVRTKRLHKNTSSSSDRLRRLDERAERFGRPRETPIETLIVIGASAGGHQALRSMLRGISYNIPAALIIMQHLPRESRTGYGLENWLRGFTAVPVTTVQSGARLQRGRVYITPPGTSISLSGRTLQLVPQTLVHPVTTINRLFISAAKAYRDRVIGVILSGLLRDGTKGLQAVHDAGGLTIVQDPDGAEYPDMPANAMKYLPVTFCLNITDIGPTLDLLARRQTALETGLSVSVRSLKERTALLVRLLAQSKRNPSTHEFLSIEQLALARDLASVQALLNEAQALTILSNRGLSSA